jgi:hypothetical protein
MCKITRILVVLFFLTPEGFSYAAGPEYTMEISLHPLRMSVNDLSSLLLKVRHFISAIPNINGATLADELVLSDGLRRFQVKGDYSISTLRSAPEVAQKASYYFSASSGAVTRISLDLGDYGRTISVSGDNQEQVEALAQLLYSDLQMRETWFGGIFMRLTLCAVLLAFGFLVPLRLKRTASQVSLSLLFMVSAYYVGFNDNLFPGTLIFKDSPSFVTRYSAEISFVGAILSFVGIVVPLVLSGFKHSKSAGELAKTTPDPKPEL